MEDRGEGEGGEGENMKERELGRKIRRIVS